MLRITHLAHREVISGHYLPQFTYKVDQEWNYVKFKSLEHCSELLIWPIESPTWPLFAPIHMKSWPKWNKVKFKSVQTLLRITHLAHRKSSGLYLPQFTWKISPKSVIRSSYYLVQFGFINAYLAPKNTICVPYLALFFLYLPLFTYIWAYLPLIALILQYVPYSPYICILLSTETAPLCKILEQSDHYSWRYCISKIWGDTSVISECSLGVNLVIDNFLYVVSDTSPLYKIWKQSDHYLWRYCILKIWGIQVSSANAVWVII